MAEAVKDTVLLGDALEMLRPLPDESVHCCVTSPPYWGLRDYGVDGQLGLERTPEEYVTKMVEVFREVRHVLRDDGTLWLNLGDCYATGAGAVGQAPGGGSQGDGWAKRGVMTTPNRMPIPGLKSKDLVGIPWRVAFALQADGWWLRQDIVWHKPNPMPESVRDRCTKAHEYIFLLSKSGRYYYDADAIAEPAVLSNAASRQVVPANWAQSGEKTAIAHSRRARGGKTAFRGQGANRESASGPANRDGRDMRSVGSKNGVQKEHDSGRRMVENTRRDRAAAGDHDSPFGATRNRRSVWTVATRPFPGAHFATFPPELIRPCIRAGSPQGGVVLDPFFGAGTTGLVARQEGRSFIGIELNPAYVEMARRRLADVAYSPRLV